MPKKKYTAEFKTKVILPIIQGNREFNAICADFNLNPDQECQFTSAEYKALLKGLQFRQSMDGKSHWADNIMIERWFCECQ